MNKSINSYGFFGQEKLRIYQMIVDFCQFYIFQQKLLLMSERCFTECLARKRLFSSPELKAHR